MSKEEKKEPSWKVGDKVVVTNHDYGDEVTFPIPATILSVINNDNGWGVSCLDSKNEDLFLSELFNDQWELYEETGMSSENNKITREEFDLVLDELKEIRKLLTPVNITIEGNLSVNGEMKLNEHYSPKDTFDIQDSSLSGFMEELNLYKDWYLDGNSSWKYSDFESRNVSFNTAVRLHNTTDWETNPDHPLYVWPAWNKHIRFSAYEMRRALAAKIVKRVKLGIVKGEVQAFTHKVEFEKPEYEKLFLKRRNKSV